MAELIVNTGALLQNYRRYAEAGQVIPILKGQRLRPWRTAAAGFAGAAERHTVCLCHAGGSAGAGTAGNRPAASVLRSRAAAAAGAVTAAGHSVGGESGSGPGHRRAAHGCAGASGGGFRLWPLRLSAGADGGDEAGIRAGQPAGAGHLLPLPGRCRRAGAVCPVQPGAAGAGRLSRGAAAHRRHPARRTYPSTGWMRCASAPA